MFIALAQLIILLAYLAYLVKRFGVLTSISDSTYFLERKKRHYFTIVLWSIALLNFFQPMEMYGAVAASMLMFTGATIVFKNDDGFSDKVHYTSAVVALVLSVVGLIVMYGMWWMPLSIIAFCGLALLLDKIKNFVWWLEIIVFLHIIGGYMLIA